MSRAINAIIGLLIVGGMFYLAYANDDRKDINIYSAPKYHYNEVGKLPAGHSHGAGHNHSYGEVDLSHVIYDWEAPAEWTGGPAGKVETSGVVIDFQGKFTVPHEGKNYKLTLSLAGGDSLSNIQRWRDFLAMKKISDGEAVKQYVTREGKSRSYIFTRLNNDTSGRSTIAAIFEETTGKHMVVKMDADMVAMDALEESFLSFCDSVKKK